MARPLGLKSGDVCREKGGLSGMPLRDMATAAIADMYQLTGGEWQMGYPLLLGSGMTPVGGNTSPVFFDTTLCLWHCLSLQSGAPLSFGHPLGILGAQHQWSWVGGWDEGFRWLNFVPKTKWGPSNDSKLPAPLQRTNFVCDLYSREVAYCWSWRCG